MCFPHGCVNVIKEKSAVHQARRATPGDGETEREGESERERERESKVEREMAPWEEHKDESCASK